LSIFIPASLLLAEDDGATTPRDAPEAEEYNFLTFQTSDAQLQGWCNTNRTAADSGLHPETEEDMAFAADVAHLHSLFRESCLADLREAVLRKGAAVPVFGKSQFGLETFFQMRPHAQTALSSLPSSPQKVELGFLCCWVFWFGFIYNA
jgi:hypothetical protein